MTGIKSGKPPARHSAGETSVKPKPWGTSVTRRLQTRILDWYGTHKRRLPWRAEPSAYRVWISEIMLQQTQVRTVLPYFERFITRFPDVEALAGAPEEEVLEHWAGLGYYRRARHLHQAARIIAHDRKGRFPETMEAIRQLPGVGRYVAGAVLSIAFNLDCPVVDGNVRRVIRRLHALEESPPEEFLWRQAEAWLPTGKAGDFNQAIMELGALVCTTPRPRCGDCPVADLCAARLAGIECRIPPARKLKRTENVEMVLIALRAGDAILMSRNPDLPFVPGTWGLPACLLRSEEERARQAARLMLRLSGAAIKLKYCGAIRHGITFRSIRAHIYAGSIPKTRLQAKLDLRWVPLAAARRRVMSSLFTKALRAALSDAD